MSEEAKIAAADSLLGKLQRGHGAGYLAARQEKPETIWPLLVECMTQDPRLDKQVESRDGFFAALVIETGMELKPLATHLYEHDDKDQSSWNTPLTVTTLGSLAKRNYQNAVEILRDYVAWGNWWNWAIDELVSTQTLEAWADLDEVFCQRLGNDESIKEELAWFDPEAEPWNTWCKQNSRLNRLVGSLKKQAVNSAQHEKHDYSNLTVGDVLRLAGQDTRICGKLRKNIVHLVKPADFEFLLSQVSIAEPERSAVALAGLTKLANPNMFDWLRDFWANNPEMPPGGLRIRAEEAMLALPPSRTLPLAREWINHSEWHLRVLAEEVLEHHATLDDVPLLREAIASALADDEDNIYRLCNLIEAFKHLPALGRIPEMECTFVEFRYSYGRARAAEALLAIDKDFFVQTIAHECLWDCEETTRELACSTVNSPFSTEASERLTQLSKAGWEDEAVRNAAIKRLSP